MKGYASAYRIGAFDLSVKSGFAITVRIAATLALLALPMALTSKLLVDVHTHVYLPRYAALLRSRSSVPFIRSTIAPNGATEDRLLILDHEPSGGRPVGSQYWDRDGWCSSLVFQLD